MNDSWSQIAANEIRQAADMARLDVSDAAAQFTRPSVLYRPKLMADGNMWCALLGDDLMVGVAGFGETPAKAMEAFDKAFLNERTPSANFEARQATGGDHD